MLKTGGQYPYLMLYNRADSTRLGNGGYPWEGRGVLLEPAISPGFVMQIMINVTECDAPGAQFYMPEFGGCWKNDGRPCDGDLATDSTRYICFIQKSRATRVADPQTKLKTAARRTMPLQTAHASTETTLRDSLTGVTTFGALLRTRTRPVTRNAILTAIRCLKNLYRSYRAENGANTDSPVNWERGGWGTFGYGRCELGTLQVECTSQVKNRMADAQCGDWTGGVSE